MGEGTSITYCSDTNVQCKQLRFEWDFLWTTRGLSPGVPLVNSAEKLNIRRWPSGNRAYRTGEQGAAALLIASWKAQEYWWFHASWIFKQPGKGWTHEYNAKANVEMQMHKAFEWNSLRLDKDPSMHDMAQFPKKSETYFCQVSRPPSLYLFHTPHMTN